MKAEDTPQTSASPSTQLMQLVWPGGVGVQAIHVAASWALLTSLQQARRPWLSYQKPHA
jgi:hypothetical protein